MQVWNVFQTWEGAQNQPPHVCESDSKTPKPSCLAQMFLVVFWTNEEANGAHWEESWRYLTGWHFNYGSGPRLCSALSWSLYVRKTNCQIWERPALKTNQDPLLPKSAETLPPVASETLMTFFFSVLTRSEDVFCSGPQTPHSWIQTLCWLSKFVWLNSPLISSPSWHWYH